ncbi:MAG TPA: DUF5063 domain-containing protein, partial [Candidatus Udaeobacter sp.]|nr:DUF5063 domain-containing protein [Candidatus Udaeobacter sp.]
MSIRNDPSVFAFYNAASAYCRILEDRPSADDAWGTQILHALSQLYARGHTLAEFGLDDGAPDLPEEFDVTDKQLSEIAARVGDYFARRDAYWDCLNSTAELYPQ